MAAIEEILNFWFGDLPDPQSYPVAHAPLWFKKATETDDLIRTRFGSTIDVLRAQGAASWTGSARGRLAAIIVLDQFTRNVYRDQAASFGCDAQALALALSGIELGQDRELALVQRVFFYLPLEHSESLLHQERSVALFQEVLDASNDAFRTHAESFLDYAVRHRDIIARFGRFPHRNEILGRPSTPEELSFLQQSGSRF